MPETGENVAEDFRISRRDQDLFALRSQQRAEEQSETEELNGKLWPCPFRKRREIRYISPKMNIPGLTRRWKRFRNETGRQAGWHDHAGNASGVNDGACALLLASETALKRHGLTPRARVVASAAAGVAPRIMGMGPVPATRKVLAKAGLSLGQMDVVELNEAFASQALAVLRELGIPDDAPHVNPNGGASP